jgi:ferric-dicitrate binding protein FerR (iron transport regulator)
VVKPISGKVRVRLKGSKTFTDLGAIGDIPLDATIDVKKGRVELASVPSPTAAAENVLLYGGWFQVRQPQAFTELTLNEPLASCKKTKARAAASKPKTRKLWGDGKGKFRTRGQFASATIRGTKWLVQDSCSGTLVRVTEGSVLVRDNVRHKNVVLRKGKRYTARPRR